MVIKDSITLGLGSSYDFIWDLLKLCVYVLVHLCKYFILIFSVYVFSLRLQIAFLKANLFILLKCII
jgi:hypothetical protein